MRIIRKCLHGLLSGIQLLAQRPSIEYLAGRPARKQIKRDAKAARKSRGPLRVRIDEAARTLDSLAEEVRRRKDEFKKRPPSPTEQASLKRLERRLQEAQEELDELRQEARRK